MARQKKPSDAVQFTYESAERIANVVRAAELTATGASPLSFGKQFPVRIPQQVRAAAFSGAWPIGGSKTVTFKYAPTATVNAVNLSWPITSSAYVDEDCLVGREGTNWWLVVPKLEARTAVFVTQTQQKTFCDGVQSQLVLTDVAIAATLNTNSCTIAIGKTNTMASIKVVSSTATGVFIQSASTASFLRVRVP